MTQDEFAISIGMTAPALEEVLDCIEHKQRLEYIRKVLRTQYNGVVLTHVQWAAAKKWYSEHPRD
jgi:hypothetical protein